MRRASKRLEARREAARLHDEHRAWVEAEIKSGATAEELGLWVPNFPPALEFIFKRLKHCNDMDRAVHLAAVDLLRSDIPLDRRSREWIAELFASLPPAKADPKRKRKAKIAVGLAIKEHQRERGMSAAEADKFVVDNLKLQSVGAFRRAAQPNRRKRN